MKQVGCVIFGCLTKPKYRLQVEDSYQTWCKDASEAGWLVRFYVDEIPDDLEEGLKALCVNLQCGDSYMSATWKQWRGLDHMRTECEPCSFYFTAGTDTFLHVRACVRFLNTLDSSDMLYIGGGMGREEILGEAYDYYSGAAIFMSAPLVESVLADVPVCMATWIDLKEYCRAPTILDGKPVVKELVNACDLMLGVIVSHHTVDWVTNPLLSGGTHHALGVNKDELLSTHLMKHEDFWDYWTYLQKLYATKTDE